MQCTLRKFENFPFLSLFYISSFFFFLTCYLNFLSFSELNSFCVCVCVWERERERESVLYISRSIHEVLLFFSGRVIAFQQHKQNLCLPLAVTKWLPNCFRSWNRHFNILAYGVKRWKSSALGTLGWFLSPKILIPTSLIISSIFIYLCFFSYYLPSSKLTTKKSFAKRKLPGNY